MNDLLRVQSISSGYRNLRVLHDVSACVREGQVVAILGPNGAGKTTLLRAISGVLRTTGRISFAGKELVGLSPAQVAALGIAVSPEGRGMLPLLSTRQNLALGGYLRRDRAALQQDLERFLTEWPVVGRRADSPAGALSGGEQQLVSLGRTMMARPRLYLLDEPSLGLAPVMVAQLYRLVRQLAESNQSILLVEQNVQQALSVADHVYVLVGGVIVHSGPASELTPQDVAHMYFAGTSQGEN